eukprot:TRINITY_DN8943_c0_g1_i6.p2 TRINITY_DN8943_c0_g1~~TRINITY_DN8943_c0_g1_i6.p2  ORF type:complete len:142 (+),score=13.91 TRINITY_DN8943_c0_g1_i6:967-1392(+)
MSARLFNLCEDATNDGDQFLIIERNLKPLILTFVTKIGYALLGSRAIHNKIQGGFKYADNLRRLFMKINGIIPAGKLRVGLEKASAQVNNQPKQAITGKTKQPSAIVELEKNKQTPSLRICLLYTSPSPRDRQKSRMPSSA